MQFSLFKHNKQKPVAHLTEWLTGPTHTYMDSYIHMQTLRIRRVWQK